MNNNTAPQQQHRERKLEDILGRLSAQQALAVARSLETERALGRSTLPTEAILAALRPQLQAGEAKRVPTLCRLACMPFEDFLTDGTEVKQPDGRIRRMVVDPWWQGLQHLGGAEMQALEVEFRSHLTGTDQAAAAAFGKKVADAVRRWTEMLLQKLSEPAGDAKLKAIFDGLGLMCDLREVARVQPMAGALRTGIDAVIAVAEGKGEARGRRLLDLGPATCAEAVRQYKAIRDTFGVHVSLFALALVNRLERPWAILLLGPELAWKQDDSLVRETEFGAIGRRMLSELELIARELRALVADQDPLAQHATQARTLKRFVEGCQAVLADTGFRKGSTWAEEVQELRTQVLRAIDGPLVPRIDAAVLAVLPQRRGDNGKDGPDISAVPDPPGIARALNGARFLATIREHGELQGFGAATRRAADEVAAALEQRVAGLVEVAPAAADNVAVAAQIEAAGALSLILHAGAHGEKLVRQLQLARIPPPQLVAATEIGA
jgi:hypothetical protein